MKAAETIVNDVHSRLNPTRVIGIVRPRDITELQAAVRDAAVKGVRVSICGGRHAMGGQQFGSDTILIDMTRMSRLLRLDTQNGIAELQAGAVWPGVIDALLSAQKDTPRVWSIRQKQTGADELTLGGALSANAHGRGLLMRPFVDDVVSVTLVMADGQLTECSRDKLPELFSLVAGGYGLFGIIAMLTLRLAPRRPMRRLVDILDVDDAIGAARRRVADGCEYGDFQYSIDPGD